MNNQTTALKISALLMWLAVSIAGCTTSTPGVFVISATLTKPPLTSLTLTPTSIGPATSTPIPGDLPTSALSSAPTATLTPLHPNLVTACPSDPFIPLEKLGLNPDARLLVVPETSESYWDENNIGWFVMSAELPVPRQMTTFFQEGHINSKSLRVSPNGQWIIFQRKAIGSDKAVPWAASLDGKRQWPLTTDNRLENGLWLDDDTVLLFGLENSGFMNSVYETVQILNPFTLEGEYVENLPPLQVQGIGATFFRYAGRTYLIYQSGDDYHLLDMFVQTDQTVLEWLRDDPADFLDKGISILSDGHMVIRVDRPYGLDMSSAMSPAEVVVSNSYSQTMRPIFLPEAIMPATAGLLSQDARGVAIVGESERFYWLDQEKGIIKDYCFSYGLSGMSRDGKFAVFVHAVLPHSQPVPKTTFVLNLETGYVSRIDGYEFIEWAWAGE